MKKWLYVALAFIIIGLIGAGATFKTGKIFQTSTYHGQRQAASLEGVRHVTVNGRSMDVKIRPTDQNKLTAEVRGWGNHSVKKDGRFKIERHGSELQINEKNPLPFFNIDFGWSELLVLVPKQVSSSLSVSTNSGDIKLSGIQMENIRVETGSGDVQADHLHVGSHFAAHAGSGDINVRQLSDRQAALSTSSGDIRVNAFTGALSAQTGSGDCELSDRQLSGNLHLQTSSGDIRLSFTNKPHDFTLHYQGDSGDADVRIPGLLYSIKTEHALAAKQGDGAIKIQARTGSGDFTVN
ncbi:MAG: DUF4097 family beta strand repeat-containing protein [Sporolactobacillus sp.]